MLLDQYKEKGLLFNKNLSGPIGDGEIYRGDLVLESGGLTERGDRKPPAIVAKQGILYAFDGKLKLLAGGLDKLSDLELVVSSYEADYASDCELVFFVHDIKEPMIVVAGNHKYILEPLDDGMIWNELLDVLCLEKSDLKGQSAEQKVVTVHSEVTGFKPKYEALDYESALGKTIEVKASARGPV